MYLALCGYMEFFMHTDAERKYAAKAARVRHTSSREGHSPTQLNLKTKWRLAVDE